jgi:hypothetical protein
VRGAALSPHPHPTLPLGPQATGFIRLLSQEELAAASDGGASTAAASDGEEEERDAQDPGAGGSPAAPPGGGGDADFSSGIGRRRRLYCRGGEGKLLLVTGRGVAGRLPAKERAAPQT